MFKHQIPQTITQKPPKMYQSSEKDSKIYQKKKFKTIILKKNIEINSRHEIYITLFSYIMIYATYFGHSLLL